MVRWKLALHRKSAFLRIGKFEHALNKATKFVRAFFKIWVNETFHRHPEEILRKAINRLLKGYRLDLIWGFATWRTSVGKLSKKRAVAKSQGMSLAYEGLYKIYRGRVRRGFARIGAGASNTNAKQRMVSRLKNFLTTKMAKSLETWKYFCFADLRREIDAKKARCVVTMSECCMSDHQRAILRWKRNAMKISKLIYGEGIKAGYVLNGVWNKLYAKKRIDHLKAGF